MGIAVAGTRHETRKEVTPNAVVPNGSTGIVRNEIQDLERKWSLGKLEEFTVLAVLVDESRLHI